MVYSNLHLDGRDPRMVPEPPRRSSDARASRTWATPGLSTDGGSGATKGLPTGDGAGRLRRYAEDSPQAPPT